MARKIKQSPKLPAATRRQQLLDSARKLFVKKGFRMTSTEEIAQNASLTKGAFYFHFEKKEDILYELIKADWETSDASVQEAMSQSDHPAHLLNVMLNAHSDCNLPEYWDMMDIWIQGLRIPRIKRYVARKLGEAAAGLDATMGSKYVSGRKQKAQLTIMTLALCDGLSFLQHLDASLVDHKAQVKLFRKMVDSMAANKKGRGQ